MKKKLDFICIGAAKSATTTLYSLIKDHPQLSLPSTKEAPFYSDDKAYEQGISWYLNHFFAGADPKTKWGTITPQYMIGEGNIPPSEIAERIYQDNPDVKIIALLRHPIERAFSHYRMLVKRGYETRSFDQAVSEILAGNTKLKGYTEPDSDYVLASEYGKILDHYYDLFPKKNILILTTDQLKDDPKTVLDQVFAFLGVDTNYQPTQLHQQSRKGGAKPRLKLLTPGFIYQFPLVKRVWTQYTPQAIRRRTEYVINLWNTKPDNERLDPNGKAYQKLVKHFSSDVRHLQKIAGIKVDWKDWTKTT